MDIIIIMILIIILHDTLYSAFEELKIASHDTLYSIDMTGYQCAAVQAD